ncbi:hypothetical protein BDZ97DRAFT_1852373, partial [Flammula alnicola]
MDLHLKRNLNRYRRRSLSRKASRASRATSTRLGQRTTDMRRRRRRRHIPTTTMHRRTRIRIRICLLHTTNTHLPLFHLTQHHSSSSSSSNQHTHSTPPHAVLPAKPAAEPAMGTGCCRIHLHHLFNLLTSTASRFVFLQCIIFVRTPYPAAPHHRLRTNFIPVLLGTHPTNTRSTPAPTPDVPIRVRPARLRPQPYAPAPGLGL